MSLSVFGDGLEVEVEAPAGCEPCPQLVDSPGGAARPPEAAHRCVRINTGGEHKLSCPHMCPPWAGQSRFLSAAGTPRTDPARQTALSLQTGSVRGGEFVAPSPGRAG